MLTRAATLLVSALGLCAGSHAAFVSGQNAAFVLGQSNFTATDSSPVQTHYFGAQDVVIDPVGGKVFVIDIWAHRILRYANADSLVLGAAPEAVLGQPNLSSFSAGTSSTSLQQPTGLAITTNGTLWVADGANHRVLRFDRATSASSGAAASVVLGQPDFSSANASTSSTGMSSPAGVYLDSADRLWIADKSNNRVLRFDSASHKPSGASADGVLGQGTFLSASAGTSAQGMHQPYGICGDSSGNLFVSDSINNRVLRFDSAATKAPGAPADGVLGQPDFSPGFASTSAIRLNLPQQISLDGAGLLAVADRNNRRCMLWKNAATLANGTAANVVLGQVDFTSSSASASSNQITDPIAAKFDLAGRLWVVDSNARRVLRFDPSILQGNAFRPEVTVLRKRKSITFTIRNTGVMPARFSLTQKNRLRGKGRIRLTWKLSGRNITPGMRAGSASSNLLTAKASEPLQCRIKRISKSSKKLRVRIALTAKSPVYPTLNSSARSALKL